MGRLVRLEVENFKSYRGHQVIGPFSGFTAVVGPNGAGKSNLMDAISFVLGVRSTHLRSSQLKDLVYRGRTVETRNGNVIDEAGDQDSRRAWVKAVYEDDNERTINFQRTITPAGDSEYRCNGRLVSLQTYNQALESQNILVKAKNFLVFQGDVEAVASQSPKDLTLLIEQISGSWELHSEYSELEKRQDAAAERSTFAYNKKRAVAAEMHSILEQKKELELYESKVQLRTKMTVEHMLHKLFASQQHASLDASLQTQQKLQAKAYKSVNRQERQIKLVEQNIEARQPKLAGLAEKVAYAQRKAKQLEENVEASEADALDNEHTRVKSAESRFEQENQGTSSAQLSDEVMAEYNHLSEQLRSTSVEDTHRRDVLDRQIQLLAEAARRASDKIEDLQSTREGLAASEHAYAQQLQGATVEMRGIEQEMQQARRDAEAAKAEHKRLVGLEIELSEKLAGVLKELAQARADQRESAREAKLRDTVSALQRMFTGVHGRLAELCRPTQHKYDVGVATVLGRLMDAIVVDRQATALECIAYMKEQRAGQATFLPLDALQPAPVGDALRHAHRGARLATDVLQYDPAIEAAVLHACGSALICDTVEVARYIAYEQQLDAKSVALDGTVIHRSGLITGGTAANGGQRAQTQRWEAAAVEGMRRARDRLTEELHEVARERRRLAKDDMLGSRVAGLQTRHQIARETVDGLTRKAQGVATERKHAEMQLLAAKPVAAQAAEQLQAARGERNEVSARIHATAQPIFASFCAHLGISSLDSFEKQLLPATEASDERRLQFTTHLARLDTQRAFERQQLEAIESQLSQLVQALQAVRESLAALQTELSTEQQQMSDSVAQIETLRAELVELRHKYGDASDSVHSARRSVEQGQRALDAMSKELGARATELERAAADRAAVLRRCKIEDIPLPLRQGSLQALPLEAGPARRHMQLSTQASASMADVNDEDIVVDYSSLPSQARSGAAAAVDQKYAEDLARLATDIDALNPNPHARERLEAARARLHNIDTEHNAARQDARDAKVEFQTVRRRRHDTFMRCYTHLATAIDHAYKALTQSPMFPLGGTAYLALEDPESPYLAGVKYHAMPPLKRFSDMEQLSGGEKTVAALALLFSLQTFRPAPFFVLDEVDAALDPLNVAKLANYLREHARGTANAPGADSNADADTEEEADPAEEAIDPEASHYSLRQSTRIKKPAAVLAGAAAAVSPVSPLAGDFQFIVISLKQELFERAQTLVGIYRDQPQNSSQVLTIDLEQFAS
ncbi:cohesin complex subunit psm1 [Kickxella alabastrina]|uniref:cohesin complex subunit psm1 n=1 Tax=Kickxella alabastrina TaxID=61397 RepID=UPI0022207937|nr:cohesin complex subunit psm1 [Kickxella alabastrina]KAI7829976.1 cohesin complex subunit psm1 [Kickxella alabastrina]